MLDKISRKTLRQSVYEKLREKIISAELLPGQTISLIELATQLGVSPMPVREALWQLERERVVIIENNKSTRVNELTAEELDEVLQLRLMLETTAATKACEVRTEEDVARIGKILGEMRSAGANLKKYLKKNQELHFGIYAIAGFPIMLQIIDALWARIGPYFNLQVFSREHLDYFLKSHEEMFVALKNRDQAKMSQALKLDLQSAAGRLRPLLVQRSLGSGSRTRRAKGTSQ